MSEIPDLAADDDIRRNPKRQRRRAAELGLTLGVAGQSLRDLGFVEQIETRKQAVFQKFEIGVDNGFEFIIVHALAAGLIDAPDRRLEGQRDRQRIARGAFDRKIADFRKPSAHCELTPVIKVGHATDIVGRSDRAEFDLDELGRGKFEFVFRLGRRVVAIALAEPANAVDGEFLLALKTNAGTGGKSKNVFCLDIVPGIRILPARGAARPKETSDPAEHKPMASSRPYPRSHRSHPLSDLMLSASGLRPDRQKDSL